MMDYNLLYINVMLSYSMNKNKVLVKIANLSKDKDAKPWV